jgi:hypothetical protein
MVPKDSTATLSEEEAKRLIIKTKMEGLAAYLHEPYLTKKIDNIISEAIVLADGAKRLRGLNFDSDRVNEAIERCIEYGLIDYAQKLDNAFPTEPLTLADEKRKEAEAKGINVLYAKGYTRAGELAMSIFNLAPSRDMSREQFKVYLRSGDVDSAAEYAHKHNIAAKEITDIVREITGSKTGIAKTDYNTYLRKLDTY